MLKYSKSPLLPHKHFWYLFCKAILVSNKFSGNWELNTGITGIIHSSSEISDKVYITAFLSLYTPHTAVAIDLIFLQIQNCSLRRINPQITALLDLRTLDMSYNNITSVPDSLGQLASIHTLNLSYNRLTTFPAILCNSRISNSLVTLNLSNNEIASIPDNIDVVSQKCCFPIN